MAPREPALPPGFTIPGGGGTGGGYNPFGVVNSDSNAMAPPPHVHARAAAPGDGAAERGDGAPGDARAPRAAADDRAGCADDECAGHARSPAQP